MSVTSNESGTRYCQGLGPHPTGARRQTAMWQSQLTDMAVHAGMHSNRRAATKQPAALLRPAAAPFGAVASTKCVKLARNVLVFGRLL